MGALFLEAVRIYLICAAVFLPILIVTVFWPVVTCKEATTEDFPVYMAVVMTLFMVAIFMAAVWPVTTLMLFTYFSRKSREARKEEEECP